MAKGKRMNLWERVQWHFLRRRARCLYRSIERVIDDMQMGAVLSWELGVSVHTPFRSETLDEAEARFNRIVARMRKLDGTDQGVGSA